MELDPVHCYLAAIIFATFIIYSFLIEILWFLVFAILALLFSTTNVAQLNMDFLGLFQCNYRIIRNANSMAQWDIVYEAYGDMTRAIRALLQRLAFGAIMDPQNPGAEENGYSSNRDRWNDY